MQKLKRLIRTNLINIPGWRTRRRIVVIESDDWGAIRQSSPDVLKKMKQWGVDLRHDHYIRNDALASESDLEALFNTLKTVQDSNGRPAAITANTIMANPDFEKMEQEGKHRYIYEPFTETLKRYPRHKKSFSLWKEGMKNGLFRPQFHGREHLQVNRWLKGLSLKKSVISRAFNHHVYGISLGTTREISKSYMAAWEWDNSSDRDYSFDAIEDGLRMFEETFGYRSLTAIAPNYTWNAEIEQLMFRNGVKGLQGGVVQRAPRANGSGNTNIRHYTGQRNKLGQIYTVRNCRFEPSENPDKDWVSSCLKEINTAFRWRKPAIIESHRVNFIGYINPENSDRNLKMFGELLEKIVKTWPDVEFVTSDRLCEIIAGE